MTMCDCDFAGDPLSPPETAYKCERCGRVEWRDESVIPPVDPLLSGREFQGGEP